MLVGCAMHMRVSYSSTASSRRAAPAHGSVHALARSAPGRSAGSSSSGHTALTLRLSPCASHPAPLVAQKVHERISEAQAGTT